jgi:hypothetical protein
MGNDDEEGADNVDDDEDVDDDDDDEVALDVCFFFVDAFDFDDDDAVGAGALDVFFLFVCGASEFFFSLAGFFGLSSFGKKSPLSCVPP